MECWLGFFLEPDFQEMDASVDFILPDFTFLETDFHLWTSDTIFKCSMQNVWKIAPDILHFA